MVGSISAEDERRRRDLHSYGLSDGQIAAKVGLTRSSIRGWRCKAGLSANRGATSGPLVNHKEHEQRLTLYRRRWSDERIANARGVARATICSWRNDYGLASYSEWSPNTGGTIQLPQIEEDRRLALYRRGMSDTAIALSVGVARYSITRWRLRRALELNDPKYKNPPVTIVSLDADLGEGGFNRHALIADDAAAAWLEENGSTVW